jgi:coenzyme PQQ precursor peptide PqqA
LIESTGAGATLAAVKAPIGAGQRKEISMAWTTPTLVEICIGLEINAYMPIEI